MGILMKMMNPRNMRQMINLSKISTEINRHMNNRCAYCDLDMGIGADYPVVEFLDHLEKEHPDKIEEKDLKLYRKIIGRVVK